MLKAVRRITQTEVVEGASASNHEGANKHLLFEDCQATCCGDLYRKSKLTGRWKKVPDRWELKGGMLLFYTSGVRISHSHPWDSCYPILGATEEATPVEKQKAGGESFCFRVVTAGCTGCPVKTLLLKAKSEAERSQWINCLRQARRSPNPSDFELLNCIGEGYFGKVLLARRRDTSGTDGLVALKEIPLKRDMVLCHAVNERVILASLPRHPFIISLRSSFRHGNFLYYEFPYCAGADLFEFLHRFKAVSSGDGAILTAQIVLALEHLHKHKIIYRDLKVENVLVDDQGYLRLADMGLAKRLQHDAVTYTLCGTHAYIAPEVLRNAVLSSKGMKIGYSYSADFWQLGCFLFELHSRRSPFSGTLARQDADAAYSLLVHGNMDRPQNMSDTAWSLTQGLLSPHPITRLGGGGNGWEEVKTHDFFAQINWDDIVNKRFTPPANLCKLKSRQECSAQQESSYCANFSKCLTKMPVEWGCDREEKQGPASSPQQRLYHKELLGFDFVA